MNWQLALVFAIICLAGTYLSWRSWHAWKSAAKGCSGDCGCGTPGKSGSDNVPNLVLISRESLKLRPRP